MINNFISLILRQLQKKWVFKKYEKKKIGIDRSIKLDLLRRELN